ncbi:MAG: hypothetical protein H0X45_01585 [Planctomycetes bacterium]|nr:hypothetical protein [Planctomycetota bacterium]
MTLIDEDAVLAGRASVRELCQQYGQALSAPAQSDEPWHVLHSWRHVDWFLNGAKEAVGRPGDWAALVEYDISTEASAEELKVWGQYGSGPFEPSPAVISCMAANEVQIHLPPETRARFAGLSKELVSSCRVMVQALEAAGVDLQELYGDPLEVATQTISGELVRKRQKALYEWFQDMLRTVLLCRFGCPTSDETPNRKFSAALLKGWIPVGYVGGFKSGRPVVFNPVKMSQSAI